MRIINEGVSRRQVVEARRGQLNEKVRKRWRGGGTQAMAGHGGKRDGEQCLWSKVG